MRARPAKVPKGEPESAGLVAQESRFGKGPRPIASALDGLIARSGHRRGFNEAGLLVDWLAIVGERHGRCTNPERLARSRSGGPGTLHLRVQPGWSTEIQHVAPVILQKVNTYLGYDAVQRIALKPGSPESIRKRARAARPDPEKTERLDRALSQVADPELADALRGLGRALLHRGSDGEP